MVISGKHSLAEEGGALVCIRRCLNAVFFASHMYSTHSLTLDCGISIGMFLYSGQVGTPLAALCTSSGSRVYMSWPAGEIVESVWDGKRWSLPFTIAHGSTRSNVSVCFSNAEEKHIRGYFQNDAGAVIEKCVNADTWPKKVCD